jgi:hypothetical protein
MTTPAFTPLTLDDIKAFIEAHPDGHWLTGDSCNCPVAIAYESKGIKVRVATGHILDKSGNTSLAVHTTDIKEFIDLVDTYSGSVNAQECLSIIKQIQEET